MQKAIMWLAGVLLAALLGVHIVLLLDVRRDATTAGNKACEVERQIPPLRADVRENRDSVNRMEAVLPDMQSTQKEILRSVQDIKVLAARKGLLDGD